MGTQESKMARLRRWIKETGAKGRVMKNLPNGTIYIEQPVKEKVIGGKRVFIFSGITHFPSRDQGNNSSAEHE